MRSGPRYLTSQVSPGTLMLDDSSLRPKGNDVSAAPATTATDLLAGRWTVDPGHSSVDFRVRHAGVARVRGTFDVFEGELVVDADGGVTARGEIDAASLTTRLGVRDEHLRSSDFLDVERHPR